MIQDAPAGLLGPFNATFRVAAPTSTKNHRYFRQKPRYRGPWERTPS
jgi:hypothetical protein